MYRLERSPTWPVQFVVGVRLFFNLRSDPFESCDNQDSAGHVKQRGAWSAISFEQPERTLLSKKDPLAQEICYERPRGESTRGPPKVPDHEGERSPRKGFMYFSDDGDLVAVRFDNWKVVFMEQRAPGTLAVWAEPFVALRLPKLYNLWRLARPPAVHEPRSPLPRLGSSLRAGVHTAADPA